MASLLKDLFSPAFYNQVGGVFGEVVPGFKKRQFLKAIFSPDFESKELKARMRHTSNVLHNLFPGDYGSTVKYLKTAIGKFRERGIGEDALAYMFLPDYIEVYGIDDYANSIKAIEFVTQFVSCEYAVRPFLLRYPERMMVQMVLWSTHKNYKVRRLASEGSRPRLPWAMAIPQLKKDPSPILPLLENLRNDPSEWVRRSVANNLNDIAKDHPDVVLRLAKKWAGSGKETDAIIKHGSRTLLKQGHTEILKHYGLDGAHVRLSQFKILTPSIKIGESLEFSFTMLNEGTAARMIRLEYAVFYRKQNGQPSKKVFKISEKMYQPGIPIKVHRKQKFILITTRKFYVGLHRLSIIMNGEEKGMEEFELTA